MVIRFAKWNVKGLCRYIFGAKQTIVDQDLIIDALRLHSDTPLKVRLLWTSDHTDTESST